MVDALGLSDTGQHLDPERAVLQCGVADDPWCRDCGGEGVLRGTVIKSPAHLPLGRRSTTLWVRVRRYRCSDCARVWRQDATEAAAHGRSFPGTQVVWALKSVVMDSVVDRTCRRRGGLLMAHRQ